MGNINDSANVTFSKNGVENLTQALFAQALARACSQLYEAAIVLLRSLLYNYPDNEWAVDAHVVLGLCYFNDGAYDQAWLTFQTVVNAFPISVYTRGVSQMIEQFDTLAATHSLQRSQSNQGRN